ncbi:MAG: S8 family serine peptidase, partial [Clostridia bacterium]|nr:S8 family serine peptidase [Clostridia bacterium]
PIDDYQIKIKKSSLKNIQKLCSLLMDFDCVELAMPVFLEEYTPDYIPNDYWNGYNWVSDWEGRIRSYHANWWVRAVEADKAWDYNDYFSNIKIGIVDSGFQTNHEDLQGKITFPNSLFEKTNIPSAHGTHVAGIIGAIPNNEVGITGLCWNSELICTDWQPEKEMGQKWLTGERIVSGFVFSVLSGAKVVNFSLGTSSHLESGTTEEYEIIKNLYADMECLIMSKLISRGYDFIQVQSAGNGATTKEGDEYAVDSTNNGYICAITPENVKSFDKDVSTDDILGRIIVVGAAKCNNDDTYSMTYFSNGGENVSIYAPGSSVYSLTYDEENPDDIQNYANMGGTSMAAPVVAGITSMVWSVNQDMTGPQVKSIVCDEKNTPVIVSDSDDEDHLPAGDGKMVNARLSVEDAVSRLDSLGTAQGKIEHEKIVSSAVSYKITNTKTKEVYRGRTADGTFSKDLPEGSYKLSVEANGSTYSVSFDVAAGKTTTVPQLLLKSQQQHLSEMLNSFFNDNIGFLIKIILLAFKAISYRV